MMQKMMAQMSPGEGKPPMEKMMGMCMGMCAEMLTALKHTNALAVFGTPELHASFTDWLKAHEDKALAVLTRGLLPPSKSARKVPAISSVIWQRAERLVWLARSRRRRLS